MESPTTPNPEFVKRMKAFLEIARQEKMYLDITGLACYDLSRVQPWYHEMDEAAHWQMQASFWGHLARICSGNPSVAFYDLINEPIVASGAYNSNYPWIVDDNLGGQYFLQRIALELNGRTEKEIAKWWIDKMVDAIREHDPETMVSIGVIAWGLRNDRTTPLFYDPIVAENLDLVCIHAYPTLDRADNKLVASRTQKYELRKPIIIEQTYNYRSGTENMIEFIDWTLGYGVDGWISFYAGESIEPLEERAEEGDIGAALQSEVLQYYRDYGADLIDSAK